MAMNKGKRLEGSKRPDARAAMPKSHCQSIRECLAMEALPWPDLPPARPNSSLNPAVGTSLQLKRSSACRFLSHCLSIPSRYQDL